MAELVRRRFPQIKVCVLDVPEGAAAALPKSEAVAGIEEAETATIPVLEKIRSIEHAVTVPVKPESKSRVTPAVSTAMPATNDIGLPGMVGCGPAMQRIYQLTSLVAPRDTTVLITGETGTGKELVAHGTHAMSRRASQPFVVVNCAAIPESLLEAELFGHVRGAFTGAVQSRVGRIHNAHGGTLFLDEIGDLPMAMQAKLLRFLQEGEVQRLGSSDIFRVDVRVICATNVKLLDHVKQKLFRQDLYYRISVFPLELPPLRERTEDIEALTVSFLEEICREADIPPKKVSASCIALLRQFHWPGNVRELRHAVERAFILSGSEPQLHVEHFAQPSDTTNFKNL
jgi:transcriptional regulator with GAF, ATPase, and Fis domain